MSLAIFSLQLIQPALLSLVLLRHALKRVLNSEKFALLLFKFASIVIDLTLQCF